MNYIGIYKLKRSIQYSRLSRVNSVDNHIVGFPNWKQRLNILYYNFHVFPGEDEISCGNTEQVASTDLHGIYPPQVIDSTTPSCGSKMFQCVSSELCIAIDQRCNGLVDCPDSSDEEHCNLVTTTSSGDTNGNCSLIST